jgi:hypothetical protein
VRVFRRAIEETGPPSTFIRLLSSDHLNDLQWIALGAITLWAISVALLLVQAEIKVNPPTHAPFFDYVIKQHAVFGGVTAVFSIFATTSKRRREPSQ